MHLERQELPSTSNIIDVMILRDCHYLLNNDQNINEVFYMHIPEVDRAPFCLALNGYAI